MSDYILKVALQRIKTSPSRFALIKGKKSSEVYVSPQPANAKQLAPIIAECGDGKTVATGICMWENDVLVFATKSAPSGAWEMMITNVFKAKQSAAFLPINLRQMGENEGDEASNEVDENAEETGSEEPPPVSTMEGNNGGLEKVKATLAKLLPLIKQALADHPARKDEILQPVQALQQHIKAGEIAPATEALQQVAAILKRLKEGGGTPDSRPSPQSPPDGNTGPEDQMTQFISRRDKLEENLLAAQKAAPDKASKLLQVWDFAQQQANAGKWALAFKALDGLQATIEKILAAGPVSDTERFGIQDGIVAERRQKLEAYFNQRVEQARLGSASGVEKLKAAFAEIIVESSELAAAINKDLNALYEDIKNRLGKALETGSRSKVAQEIESCRSTVATDKLIQHLAETPGGLGVDSGVPVQFTELFDDAVNQMEMVDA